MTVAAGVIKIAPDNSFEPAKPVSGAEALAAIDRISALAGADKIKSER